MDLRNVLFRSVLQAMKRCVRKESNGESLGIALRKNFAPGTGAQIVSVPSHGRSTMDSMEVAFLDDEEDGDHDVDRLGGMDVSELDDGYGYGAYDGDMYVAEERHVFYSAFADFVEKCCAETKATDTEVRAEDMFEKLSEPLLRNLLLLPEKKGKRKDERIVEKLSPSLDQMLRSLSATDAVLKEYAEEGLEDVTKLTSGRLISVGFALLRQCNLQLHVVDHLSKEGFCDPNRRDSMKENYDVNFSVGDVVKHKLFGRGVVISWDKACKAHPDWIQGNQINTILADGVEQPFYSLLLEDGTSRYCSQENLSLEDGTKNGGPIRNNDMVSFYFASFCEKTNRHVPNTHLGRLFPDDEAHVAQRSIRANVEGDSPATRREYAKKVSAIDEILESSENELLQILKTDPSLSHLAEERLWTLWHSEAGEDAAEKLEVGVKAMQNRNFEAARHIFAELRDEFPDWAEVVNKQAVLHFHEGLYDESLRLCDLVLRSKPHHIGALNGAVKCNIELARWASARRALERCMESRPYTNAWPLGFMDFLMDKEREEGKSEEPGDSEFSSGM